MTTRQAGRVWRSERPDASMSLITDLFANALDEGYAEAAARQRAAGGPEPSGSRRRMSPALMAGLLGLGLLLTTAVLQVRADASIISAERESLVERIGLATGHADALEQTVADLERDILGFETRQLSNAAVNSELHESMATMRSAAGTGAVQGPGVVVEVDDAENGTDGGSTGAVTSVLDIDLQQVVNGLWAAGAEAVSINGQRVTAMTAIRSANDVILVNFRPLEPPYEVRAVGDSRTLGSRFLEGPGGQWLLDASSTAGIQFDIRNVDSLTLPAARAVLRLAQPEEAT
ncbi:MAG TPA: DUF881 domain-containing protein [Jiangellaceae bacterium]|nr:DUF881 domain-containing protein [Jiangellaceae bacterium]